MSKISIDPFSAYARLWAFSNLALQFAFCGGSVQILLQAGLLQIALTAFALATLVAPTYGRILVAGHAVAVAAFASMLPTVFDADFWAMHHDVAFLLAALATKAPLSTPWTAKDRAAVFDVASACMRIQLCLWYSGAMIWKLNAAFFDTSNCPTLYFMQLVDCWVPFELPDSVVYAIAWSAPHMTELIEGGLALLIIAPGGSRFAVALGVALHWMIGITPPPHNISSYGVRVVPRYVALLPEASVQVCTRLGAALRGRASAATSLALALAAVIVAAHVHLGFVWGSGEDKYIQHRDKPPPSDTKGRSLEPPPGEPDWHLPNLVVCSLFALAAAAMPMVPRPADALRCPTWLRRLVTFEGVLFVYGLILFGLADDFPPKPFSNIRVHGGSNHLFLPTDVLGRYFGLPTVASDVVLVERSTCAHINAILPSELTHKLTPGTKALLQKVGHSGRVFGPAWGRNVSPEGVTPNGAPFVRYTLPSFELRRVLSEARAEGDGFELEYRRLPRGYSADAPARAALATLPLTRLVEKPGGQRSCTVTAVNESTFGLLAPSTVCAPDEPALMPPPHWLSARLNMFWPNVLLDDAIDGHRGYCMYE